MSGNAALPATSARGLVERLGGHRLGAAGIEPAAGDAELLRWWVLALLLSSRHDAARAEALFAALCDAGLVALEALAAAPPAAVVARLEAAGARDPSSLAARLVRSSGALARDHAGSLEALARGCLGLEELGERLARLGPGIGAGSVARFLRPLRELWPAAWEIPLLPAARAAARHLGWIGEGEDEEGEPGALRAFLRSEPDAPPLRDVEAALERLGAAACHSERPQRCPLGAECPAAGFARSRP